MGLPKEIINYLKVLDIDEIQNITNTLQASTKSLLKYVTQIKKEAIQENFKN